MLKVFIVILIGVAVGVTIELVLARRQRARRVVLDEPDLPPGATVGLYGDFPDRRRRAQDDRSIGSADTSIVFDDDGGFRILGPVRYDDAMTSPRDRSGEVSADERTDRSNGTGNGSGGSDLGQ